jgi:hypothetical protein
LDDDDNAQRFAQEIQSPVRVSQKVCSILNPWRVNSDVLIKQIDLNMLNMLVELKCASMQLGLRVDSSHLLAVQIKDVGLSYAKRPRDAVTKFHVYYVALNDSKRPSSHPAILWTPLTDVDKNDDTDANDKLMNQDNQFVQVSFMACERGSPHYVGDDAELSVSIRRICLFIDTMALDRLVPFVRQLCTKTMEPAKLSVVTDNIPSAEEIVSQVPQRSAQSGKTMHMVCHLEAVSLSLLECKTNCKTDENVLLSECFKGDYSLSVSEIL